MSNAEVVYCKCGVMIAACVIGYQSAQWHRDLRKYMKEGYVIKHVPSSEVKLEFGSCTCKKQNPVQLDIFKD